MPAFPIDPAPDASLAFLREGYAFISNRCRRLGSDAFHTRLLGRPVTCASGAEAAQMFYEPRRFTRNGAMPKSALKLLQDEGSVATLDDEAHRVRKAMFLSLLGPDRAPEVARLATEALRESLAAWSLQRDERVRLHSALHAILCRAACAWAAVPADAARIDRLTHELAAMINNAGAFGPRNWQARLRRKEAERFMAGLVEDVRAGRRHPPEDSPLAVIARHRDADGRAMTPEVCAVEMLNILRPADAIARFLAFGVLAMHRHPAARDALRAEATPGPRTHAFVQEVRRFYPFFPAVGGKAREAFSWRGHDFSAGDWVILDLYGTDHDARLWPEPEAFRPERFLNREPDAYALIPQGGGDHAVNHRCPGEWVTIETMTAMLHVLATEVAYDVPDQDLGISLRRMPALPADGMVITNVRMRT
ncbi:fatty acid beta hydroxylase (cytochrome P450) [Caenispirillum salinarum AK4]|uniref:Fatty acid beta hydroxylase (Cytochrome P450) n=1 Tax=Caenispirillum salinarum AK4 TaxID=1238182 RepID=K9GYV0_9PROT|nr:cytochrome P450 [Caenispirillum salinarum]EKV29954.1 fatty acid beta hydroxylase (cytochrome P450) [Caenispirillum salinarum AK4]